MDEKSWKIPENPEIPGFPEIPGNFPKFPDLQNSPNLCHNEKVDIFDDTPPESEIY